MAWLLWRSGRRWLIITAILIIRIESSPFISVVVVCLGLGPFPGFAAIDIRLEGWWRSTWGIGRRLITRGKSDSAFSGGRQNTHSGDWALSSSKRHGRAMLDERDYSAHTTRYLGILYYCNSQETMKDSLRSRNRASGPSGVDLCAARQM